MESSSLLFVNDLLSKRDKDDVIESFCKGGDDGSSSPFGPLLSPGCRRVNRSMFIPPYRFRTPCTAGRCIDVSGEVTTWSSLSFK